MSMTHNTSVSMITHWDWRVPPADRRNSEVKTYYLNPEELEKYRKKGEKKVEEQKEYKTEPKNIREALKQEFATGKKTFEEIASEHGNRLGIVKAIAARMGLIEKKEKPQKEHKRKSLVFQGVTFSGNKTSFTYVFDKGELKINGGEQCLILDITKVKDFIEEIREVAKRIQEVDD